MEIKPTYVSIPFEEREEYQRMKSKLEEEFKLEVGKDYCSIINRRFIVIDRKGKWENLGFVKEVGFSKDITCYTHSQWREATEEEVIEAFEKECVRRFGENWRGAKLKTHADDEKIVLNTGNHEPFIKKLEGAGWVVWNKNGCVYYGGKWAESWEEPKFAECLEDIDRPWYLDTFGEAEGLFEKKGQDKNHLPTKELTEGLLALTQLLSFRHDVWDKEGRPVNGDENYSIGYDFLEKEFGIAQYEGLFCFKTKETAKWFLKTHEELLSEYFNKLVR